MYVLFGASEDNQLPGLHPSTQAYIVFDGSINRYILICLHLVPLSFGASVQHIYHKQYEIMQKNE